MQYIGLDFETANSAPESACSVGLGIFRDQLLQKELELLVKPPEQFNTFNQFNTFIHGIHKEDVENSPTFEYIWPKIHTNIEGNLLICHNASFDIRVLKRLLDLYHLHFQPFYYICTVKVSQKVWPNLKNHKLNTVSRALQIPLHHHQAASDAVAAAYILLYALQKTNSRNVFELGENLGIQIGYVSKEKEIKCSSPKNFLLKENLTYK